MGQHEMTWDGFDCNGVYEALGHWEWAHKKTVLIIKNSDGLAFIPKGEILQVDKNGNAVSKIKESCLDPSVLRSAQRLFLSPKD